MRENLALVMDASLSGARVARELDASWFGRSIIDTLATLRGAGVAASPAAPELSRREREVLELVCDGLDNEAIAREMKLAGNTVLNHIFRLYAKIGVNRRSAAALEAKRGIRARCRARVEHAPNGLRSGRGNGIASS